MKKILMFAGLGCSLLLLVVILSLSGNIARDIDEFSVIKAKKDKSIDGQEFDEDYMDFYELTDFDTDLPVIYVNTAGNEINRDGAVMSKVSILGTAGDGSFHNIKDTPDITLNAGIKYRGASSNNFDKRQYRITFFKNASGSKKLRYDLFGMGAADSWVLNGPFLDKTLARNYLVYNLGSQIMEWAPECRYCELFVNGQYKGVYLAVEPVSAGEGRLDLSEYGLLSGKAAYIVGRDREGSDFNPLKNYGKLHGYTSNDLYVEYPGSKSITEKEFDFITEDISRFEMALYGDDFANPKTGYAAYIDVDNFVDYYILNEVVMNHDAGNLSTYAYKEINGKLKMAIWDYNNCYDNYQWFSEEFDVFYLPEMAWFHRLLQDRAFVDKVVKRYYELRDNQLLEANIFSILDDSQTILGEAIDRNYKVWGYTFRKNLLTGKGRDIKSFEDADSQLRYSITKRFNYLDKHITDLYELCVN